MSIPDPPDCDAPAPGDADAEARAIRRAALNLLARREHSRRELRDKLRRRFADGTAIDLQLDHLERDRLQSDDRFAESFVRQRIARGFGPQRIAAEARSRGLRDEELSAALRALRPDWPSLAAAALAKKFGAAPAVDIHERARRARFLQYRGFSSEQFKQLLED